LVGGVAGLGCCRVLFAVDVEGITQGVHQGNAIGQQCLGDGRCCCLVGHDKGTGLGAYSQTEARRSDEQRQFTAADKGVPVASVQAVEPETVQLERRVRAAASAATDESGFLHHLQEQEVAVRPRFATGDRATVVGMSVAMPTRDGQSLIWHGGGRLAAGEGPHPARHPQTVGPDRGAAGRGGRRLAPARSRGHEEG